MLRACCSTIFLCFKHFLWKCASHHTLHLRSFVLGFCSIFTRTRLCTRRAQASNKYNYSERHRLNGPGVLDAGQHLPHGVAQFSWINKNYRITVKLSARLVYKFSNVDNWISHAHSSSRLHFSLVAPLLLSSVRPSVVCTADLFSLLLRLWCRSQSQHISRSLFCCDKNSERQFANRLEEVGLCSAQIGRSRSSLYSFLFSLSLPSVFGLAFTLCLTATS